MTSPNTRQKVLEQINHLSPEQLVLVANFIESLQQGSIESLSSRSDEQPILTGSTVADLLEFSGTWQGDDFEDCLQSVYDTRLPAEF